MMSSHFDFPNLTSDSNIVKTSCALLLGPRRQDSPHCSRRYPGCCCLRRRPLPRCCYRRLTSLAFIVDVAQKLLLLLATADRLRRLQAGANKRRIRGIAQRLGVHVWRRVSVLPLCCFRSVTASESAAAGYSSVRRSLGGRDSSSPMPTSFLATTPGGEVSSLRPQPPSLHISAPY